MALALESLTNLNAQELREMVTELMAQVGENAKTIASKDREILYRQTRIDQLTHEMAVLKRWKFGRSREQLDQAQASLLDEAIDADIAAIEEELEQLAPRPASSPSVQRCRPSCPAWRCTTNPHPPTAPLQAAAAL